MVQMVARPLVTVCLSSILLFAAASSSVSAWFPNPASDTWFENGGSNERFWEARAFKQWPNPAPAGVDAITYKPSKTFPPVQLYSWILLASSSDANMNALIHVPSPEVCATNQMTYAQPTFLTPWWTAGAGRGGTPGTVDIRIIAQIDCLAMVAPPLLTADPTVVDGGIVVIKALDFANGNLHILFLDGQCGAPAPAPGDKCGPALGMVHDSLVGTVPLRIDGTFWWEPNQVQGVSELADPVNPIAHYDDVVFVASAGGGFESRLVSIDFAAASATRWADAYAGAAAGGLLRSCGVPGPGPCQWQMIPPPPIFGGFSRGLVDLAEFPTVGQGTNGHFAGFMLRDEGTQPPGRPALVVVNFLTGELVYANWMMGESHGLVCQTLPAPQANPPQPPGPPRDPPAPGPTPGVDMGQCVYDYGDAFTPVGVDVVSLQHVPQLGQLTPCFPQKSNAPGGVPLVPCTVFTAQVWVLTGQAGQLKAWNLPTWRFREFWVVTETGNPISIEIARVFVGQAWGPQVAQPFVTWAAPGNGNARVTESYAGAFDGSEDRPRFWLIAHDDSVWNCPVFQSWHDYLVKFEWDPNQAKFVGLNVVTNTVEVAPGPNCQLAANNEGWGTAAMIVEDPLTFDEQLWYLTPCRNGNNWNAGGGDIHYLAF